MRLVLSRLRRGVGSTASHRSGRGIEPLYTEPKPDVLPLNDPGTGRRSTASAVVSPYRAGHSDPPVALPEPMGSLIKKRRKRMRKKKHKKMLRRTRHQRRK